MVSECKIAMVDKHGCINGCALFTHVFNFVNGDVDVNAECEWVCRHWLTLM